MCVFVEEQVHDKETQPHSQSQPSHLNEKVPRDLVAVNVDIKTNLLNSISNYESMVTQTSNEIEKRIIADTITTLKKQLETFETSEKKLQENKFQYGPPKTILKREERRTKALAEVYNHYCKLYSSNESARMPLSAFTQLINDFQLFRDGEDKKVYLMS